ncbi:hypothetical protein CVT26_005254 [Gymnopilus dilepis]|uniref:Uncharacterized protein n=1 Tax=Gymnopilus dilepis TaxID=231916 RepID=A0A409YVQ9_9AGAR|nr:hypothetical protein CVT26_005254 [Gymnopilus dilepis]
MSAMHDSLPTSTLLSQSASTWLDGLLSAVAKAEQSDRASIQSGQDHDNPSRQSDLPSNDNPLAIDSKADSPCNDPDPSTQVPEDHLSKIPAQTTESLTIKISLPKSRPRGRTNKKEDDRILALATDPDVAFFTPHGVVHAKCWRYVRTDRRRRFYAGFYQKHAGRCDGSGEHFRGEANFMGEAVEVYRGGYRGRIDKRFASLAEMVGPL